MKASEEKNRRDMVQVAIRMLATGKALTRIELFKKADPGTRVFQRSVLERLIEQGAVSKFETSSSVGSEILYKAIDTDELKEILEDQVRLTGVIWPKAAQLIPENKKDDPPPAPLPVVDAAPEQKELALQKLDLPEAVTAPKPFTPPVVNGDDPDLKALMERTVKLLTYMGESVIYMREKIDDMDKKVDELWKEWKGGS